jgi:hypothetical protein
LVENAASILFEVGEGWDVVSPSVEKSAKSTPNSAKRTPKTKSATSTPRKKLASKLTAAQRSRRVRAKIDYVESSSEDEAVAVKAA